MLVKHNLGTIKQRKINVPSKYQTDSLQYSNTNNADKRC